MWPNSLVCACLVWLVLGRVDVCASGTAARRQEGRLFPRARFCTRVIHPHTHLPRTELHTAHAHRTSPRFAHFLHFSIAYTVHISTVPTSWYLRAPWRDKKHAFIPSLAYEKSLKLQIFYKIEKIEQILAFSAIILHIIIGIILILEFHFHTNEQSESKLVALTNF